MRLTIILALLSPLTNANLLLLLIWVVAVLIFFGGERLAAAAIIDHFHFHIAVHIAEVGGMCGTH